MKKTFAILFLVFSLLIPPSPFSSAQIYNGDYSKLQRLGLYKENKVWMVYGWTFLYPKGIQEKKGKKTSFERFDREGNRSEEIYYDTKGNPNYSCQYFYDDNGIESKKVGGSGDEIIYEKWNYTSVENGKKMEKKSEYKKGKDQKWIYMYDAQQNISEEDYYDVNGTISHKWAFTYDGKQNVTEKKEYDPYGNVYQKWLYKYDEKGNNIELHHFVSNNQLYRIYQMRYDKKGNMKSKFEFDKDENVLQLTVFIYQFYEGLHAPRTTGNKQ
ncbi:MAG: hypothetical protein HY841_02530 [Bacteroidetes bacterium]|nr:hypothetical protein [Bacteroidota bacterium]